MSHTIVLYHENCLDGLVAAWSLGCDPKATTYIPYNHSKPETAERVFMLRMYAQPEMTRVIAVDCFPEFIRGSADAVIVIDHHDSAKDRLTDRTGLTEVVFDQSHSAAPLAWEWAHPGHEVPILHRYVEDRDIWAWKMEDSHAVSAYLATVPLTLENVSTLRVDLQFVDGFDAAVAAGNAILAYQAQVIASAVKRAERHIYEGVPCAVVNCTNLISETGHALVEGTDTPIALLYRIDGDTLNVSVRTAKNSPIKANTIAERFGGGGHQEAAGFHVTLTSGLLPLIGVR